MNVTDIFKYDKSGYQRLLMSEIGYVIRYRPYTLEENSEDEIYHNHFNSIDEFFLDETEFNARITDLENGYFEDLDGSIYDGVDIDDLYWCELHRISSR